MSDEFTNEELAIELEEFEVKDLKKLILALKSEKDHLKDTLSVAHRTIRAIRAYADDCYLVSIRKDLLNILGYPHYHIAGTTKGYDIDKCALCHCDLRDVVHSTSAIEAAKNQKDKIKR